MWISIFARFREAEPAAAPSPPADLNRWAFLGCLEIEMEPWEGEADAEELALPRELMLLPDDFDQWGRDYPSFRALALPVGGEPTPDPDTPFRWFTRADTLWVVWSEGRARGGVALREREGRLSGRVVVRRPNAPGEVTAPARAWPINCHTRARPGWRPVIR